jgi:acetylornithine/succinyldiaminopimelate/putrescine aminotransferase
MLGLELRERDDIPAFRGSDRAASLQLCDRLHEAGLLLIPSGPQIVRLLPAYNLTRNQAEGGIGILEGVLRRLG